MNDSALTLPQLKTELAARIDRLEAKIDTVKTELDGRIEGVETRLEAKIDTVKTELDGRIEGVETRLEAKIDTVKLELKTEIDRLDAKIDTVKSDLEAKLDDRTAEVLDTIRETAEMIDARQERRASATLVAQRQWLQEHVDKQVTPLFSDQARTRGALDEHLRDDTRHLKPRAPKTAR